MTHAELVDFLRGIHARPGGTGAILNLIRGAKVRGAADLNILTDVVADASLRLELAHHGLDESRHACRLITRMEQLRVTPTRLPAALDRVEGLFARCRARDVRDVYQERGWLGEVELLEFLTAVLLPEEDAVAKLAANHEALVADPATQALVGRLLRDDRRHVAYLRARLTAFAERFSRRAVMRAEERLRAVLKELDVTYYAALEGYLAAAAGIERAA
jgi:hypothetical protein